MRLFKFLLLLPFFFIPPIAHAETMYNGSYRLQMGTFNSVAGKVSDSSYSLTFTGGQTSPGLYSGTNYIVKSGFQYISSIIPFAFSITNTTIDFGTLSPTNPVTRTSTLTVSDQSASGYSVTAVENHQLLVPSSGALIPDTTCDGGTCTQTTAAAWANTLTYGFGYRCDNVSAVNNGASNSCVAGDSTFFSNPTYYKQFADESKTESAQTIMSGTSGRNQRTTVTYKVNIASSQPPGLYTNTITYVATPTY